MSDLLAYSCLLIMSTFISSVSQIMLKISTGKKYDSWIKEYLNPPVIIAYGLFFICTFLTMYSLKAVPLSMAPILEASGYVFVALLSRIILKERITKKKVIGLAIIVVGIVIYSL